jgi:tetratricopeptide (TPR) repeat protein
MRGDLEGAEHSFRQGLATDQEESNLLVGYNNLGVLLLESERFEEARDTLDKGLAIDNDAVFLLKNRGRVALAMGDGEGAVEYWERAVEIAPDYLDAHRLLAERYETNGQIDKAKVHWTEVLKSEYDDDRRAAGEALQRIESQ